MINKPMEMTSLDNHQVSALNSIIGSICDNAAGVVHTDKMPTVNNVPEGTFTIYDDGAGTKRIYVVTKKGNLGYLDLT